MIGTLQSLLKPSVFVTAVVGGAWMADAAELLGRVPQSGPNKNAKRFSGCSTGGPRKADGGIVPMLTLELADADASGSDMRPLATMLECTASRLSRAVGKIEAGLDYGDGQHAWRDPVDTARDYVAAGLAADKEIEAVGWQAALPELVGFNAATLQLLHRERTSRARLAASVALLDNAATPPPAKCEVLHGSVVLTVTAGGGVGDYADTAAVQRGVTAAAGVDASLITISVAVATTTATVGAADAAAAAASTVRLTAIIAVPASTTAGAVQALLSTGLSTAAAAAEQLGVDVLTVPTSALASPETHASVVQRLANCVVPDSRALGRVPSLWQQVRSAVTAEFALVQTCRYTDRDCTPTAAPAPAPALVAAAAPSPPPTNCFDKDDASGFHVTDAPFSLADAKLLKGRTVQLTFPEEEEATFAEVTKVAEAEQGDPSISLKLPGSSHLHVVRMSELKAGTGAQGEALLLVPFWSLSGVQALFNSAQAPSLKAEAEARGLPRGTKAELQSALLACFAIANDATQANAARMAALAAANAALRAAAAASQRPPPPPPPTDTKSWFAADSTAAAAWNSRSGFDGMQHGCVQDGDVAVCAYSLGTLHAVELRFVSAFWARLLRLAGLFGVFAQLQKLMEAAQLCLSNARGAWHIAQCHGNQIGFIFDKLNWEDVANLFPSPIDSTLSHLLPLFPYYVHAIGHAFYPPIAYEQPCATLIPEIHLASRIFRTGMSSLFPTTRKPVPATAVAAAAAAATAATAAAKTSGKSAEDASAAGMAASAAVIATATDAAAHMGAFTPPANWAAVTEGPLLFEQFCEEGGSASLGEARFELAHTALRSSHLHTAKGGQFGGRNVNMDLLENMVMKKLTGWRKWVKGGLINTQLHTYRRHRKRAVGYRKERLAAVAAMEAWLECARTPSCSWHEVAADHAQNSAGYHRSASNKWRSVAADDLEQDDTTPCATGAAEENDDLDPGQGSCPTRAGAGGGGGGGSGGGGGGGGWAEALNGGGLDGGCDGPCGGRADGDDDGDGDLTLSDEREQWDLARARADEEHADDAWLAEAAEGPTDDAYGEMLERGAIEGGEIEGGEEDVDEEHEPEYRGTDTEIEPIGEAVVAAEGGGA